MMVSDCFFDIVAVERVGGGADVKVRIQKEFYYNWCEESADAEKKVHCLLK